ATTGDSFEGKKVAVSGSGNVAKFAIEMVHQLGGTVIACSDSGGYVLDPDGIDVDLLRQVKDEHRGRMTEYAQTRGSRVSHVPDGSIWDVPCDIALPCATQNELNASDATTMAKNGCTIVAAGANVPTASEAIRNLSEAGVRFVPCKTGNAGGVATSTPEMKQNASSDS